MSVTTSDGVIHSIPGTYATTVIQNAGSRSVPEFNVGIIIGSGVKGLPFSATSKLGSDLFKAFDDPLSFQREYGTELESPMSMFHVYAKKMAGMGRVYALNANPVTQMTGGLVTNQNVSPVADALTISTKGYGAGYNDTSLTIAASVHTVIPAKNTTFLTTNSGTAKTISVNDARPFNVGDTIYLVDNTTAAVSKVVEAVDIVSTPNTITVTVAISSEITTALYARVFQPDTSVQEVSAALTTPALVTAFYSTSKYLSCVIKTALTEMPTTLAVAYVHKLPSATAAVSPAATTANYTTIANAFQQWNEEFAVANGYYIRVIGLVTSDATNHTTFRDLTTASGTNNRYLQVVTGCALGDWDNTDATLPATRAAVLNSDNVQLIGYGLDGLAPFKSLAGEMFGIRLGNPLTHNQTRDVVVASTVEKAYLETSSALATITAAGVIGLVMDKTGYLVNQGLTTYQDHSYTFNPSTGKTYLVMLRDLADYDTRGIIETLKLFAGGDKVTAQVVTSAAMSFSQGRVNEGAIASFEMVSVTKSGNAWVVERKVAIDNPTDFIAITNIIEIPA